MKSWQFYGVIGAGLVAWSGAMHWTGRLVAAGECEKRIAASAGAAIDEKNGDDEKQGSAAGSSDAALRAQIERLTRKLETAYVPTGLDCDAPGSGDSVLDAHDEIFEAGLPSGR